MRERSIHPRRTSILVVVLAAVLIAVPAASAASAGYDPVGSGTTTLRFEGSFLSFLRANRIKLAAVAPASIRGGALVLPVAGGMLDPTSGKGTIDTEGALILESPRRKVPLRRIVVKTKHSPLIAKVGGSQLKLAASSRLASGREGFGSDFSARNLKLSAKVATRLNKKLRPRLPFTAGQAIGSIVARTQPQTVAILEGNRAMVEFAPDFLAKLNALFVAANPIFPAEHSGPQFTLPIIAGGAISPDAALGTLKSGGSIEFLQLGSNAQVLWHEFWFELAPRLASPELDAEPAPPLGGKAGRLGALDLGAGAVTADPRARTIAEAGAALTLPAATAELFNQAFAEGREVFAPGEEVGVLGFTAQAH